MATEWSDKIVEANYPLGHPPLWATYPLPMTPVLAISVESPLGPGSILERCWFYMQQSASSDGSMSDGDIFEVSGLTIHAWAEVYSVGSGGVPDPRGLGTGSPVLRANSQTRARSGNTGTSIVQVVNWSTDGLVRSEAKRGPAEYGGGTPELRVGIYTSGLITDLWIGSSNTTETYQLAALWKL